MASCKQTGKRTDTSRFPSKGSSHQMHFKVEPHEYHCNQSFHSTLFKLGGISRTNVQRLLHLQRSKLAGFIARLPQAK
jgi:hypothetical protein